MRLFWAAMLTIGLSACAPTQRPAVVHDFCQIITTEIAENLAVRETDDAIERQTKDRIRGYRRCICLDDCPN